MWSIYLLSSFTLYKVFSNAWITLFIYPLLLLFLGAGPPRLSPPLFFGKSQRPTWRPDFFQGGRAKPPLAKFQAAVRIVIFPVLHFSFLDWKWVGREPKTNLSSPFARSPLLYPIHTWLNQSIKHVLENPSPPHPFSDRASVYIRSSPSLRRYSFLFSLMWGYYHPFNCADICSTHICRTPSSPLCPANIRG